MSDTIERYDSEEARERAALVKERETKSATIIFMVAATVVEIAVTLAVVLALIIACAAFVYKALGVSPEKCPPIYFEPFVFIGGIALGFFLYKKIMRLAIDRLRLKEKIRPDVYAQYLSKKERKEFDGR